MNLFSSNFNSVKAVINKAVINEKTSKNSYKKLISNIKQKETKNIIKLAGIGVSLISTIYFVIKRYNKYTKENIQQENEAQIKKLQQENEAQIKKLQQENEAQIKEIQQENEAKLKEIQQENEARIKKLQQENEAQIKKIQEKDNTRRKKEVQLKKNSKQWFETFETQYKEMVISFRENLNSDEKIKIFVNFCLE
ncbi:MAG: hypothetical protein LBJ32_01125, partial [Oscillospiraceae bacterium]|nr:hypothetical protein [Oscillospiraceae bacterium]